MSILKVNSPGIVTSPSCLCHNSEGPKEPKENRRKESVPFDPALPIQVYRPPFWMDKSSIPPQDHSYPLLHNKQLLEKQYTPLIL